MTLLADKTHILWDHDGVLVDTEPLYFDATRACLAPLGIHVEPADYLRRMASGGSLWELAEAAGIDPAVIDAQRGARNRLYQRHLAEQDIGIPGVEARLARRYAMAIVTAAKRADFDIIHAHRNITAHMQFVLTNDSYANGKPAPDPYLTALERFGIDARQAVVVEDSERGLRSALAAGIDCVIVDSPFTRTLNFDGAIAHIASLAELPGLLGAAQ